VDLKFRILSLRREKGENGEEEVATRDRVVVKTRKKRLPYCTLISLPPPSF
jgi:hypothetical protein